MMNDKLASVSQLFIIHHSPFTSTLFVWGNVIPVFGKNPSVSQLLSRE